jgi:hypothetical protein
LTGNGSRTAALVIGRDAGGAELRRSRLDFGAAEERAMIQARCRIAFLLALLPLTATGCHSGKPLIPAGWTVSRAEPGAHAREFPGRLQLIVCYGAGLSNHAAVRIESPPDVPLFWDPGGRFGTVPPLHERVRCLVLDRPPTLDQYWRFRTDFCAERWMEVFEWDVAPEEAKRLREILRRGSTGRGGFDTDYVGLACAVGVSDFLRYCRAAGIWLDDWYFLPHSLAARLWGQHPSRVWEYRLNEAILCVTPPPDHASNPSSNAQ